MPRKVDPEVIAAAMADYERGTSVRAAALAHGISWDTLNRARNDPLRASAKQRLLQAVVDGESDVGELQRIVGLDRHNIVHLLWSLQKQGYVVFNQRRNGSGQAVPTNVIATKIGAQSLAPSRLATVARTSAETGKVAEPPVTPPAPDPTPTATPTAWPELERLTRRNSALTAAARMLAEGGLDDLYELTMGEIDKMTPVEREYVMFAREHGRS